jgi:glycine cleavage system H protein
VNTSPYEHGWLVKVKLADKGEINKLLSAQDYRAHIGETAGAGGD